MCQTTSAMRFDHEYIEFFALLQFLFGASITNVLHGPAHCGKLIEEEVERNAYNPVSGKCNFAIPSAHSLSKLDIGYPKEIPCGKIKQTLQIAEEQSKEGKQFTLSFDGKLVAQGSFGVLNGDVDLWGCEGVISVHQALKNHDKLIKSVSALEKTLLKKYLPAHVTILQNISLQISKQICHLRSKLRSDFFNRQRLFKLVQQNPDHSYGLHKVLSTINTNSADCKNVI